MFLHSSIRFNHPRFQYNFRSTITVHGRHVKLQLQTMRVSWTRDVSAARRYRAKYFFRE